MTGGVRLRPFPGGVRLRPFPGDGIKGAQAAPDKRWGARAAPDRQGRARAAPGGMEDRP